MQKLKTRIRQISYRLKHNFFTFDNIIFLIAGTLCLTWTYGAITSMTRNWDLARKVASAERELALLELEVDTMELEKTYYASAEYQELAARELSSKSFPGETLIYLPENSDAAKTKYSSSTASELATADPEEQSNFSQWLSFLFGA
jgi:hypothetical protein